MTDIIPIINGEPQPTYHKIQSIFKRDAANKYKTFLFGEYTLPGFSYLADCVWEWTEKIDGTNIRFHVGEDGQVRFGGRTHRAQIPPMLFRKLEEIAANPAWESLTGLTVYGEGYGAGIQKGGGLYRPDPGFIAYDVMVTKTGKFLSQGVAREATQPVVDFVPTAKTMTLDDMVFFMQQHSIAAEGDPWYWSSVAQKERLVEGFVGRPRVELYDTYDNRMITKIKIKDFPE